MTTCFMPPTNPEAYSEPSQTSKLELFAKIVNGYKPLTIFAKLRFLEAPP